MNPLLRKTLEPAVEFVSLAHQPQWLMDIVQWHQQQWPHESLQQRTLKLEQHLDAEPFPTTLVALEDGRLVGSISVVCYQRLGGLAPSHWLANAFVVPEFRCRGVGAQLVCAGEAYARKQGLSELYLYATDRVSFYQKLHWCSLKQKRFKGELATIMRRDWSV